MTNDAANSSEEIEQLFRTAPRLAHWTQYLAMILGALAMGQMLWAASQGEVGWGKAVLSGLIRFATLFFCGAMVIARSKWFYFLLLFFVVQAFPTEFAYAVHLQVLILKGASASGDSIGRVASVIGALRLAVGVALVVLMLTRDVRGWVFGKKTG